MNLFEDLVGTIEYTDCRFQGKMLDAMNELLQLYDENGAGWYMIGNFDSNVDEGQAITCEIEEGVCPEWRSMWLPNPFMHPYFDAYRIRNMGDLMGLAFECADNEFDAVAFAGTGKDPLESVIVRGEEHDMRIG